jgi:lipid-A-disaccharide synthase
MLVLTASGTATLEALLLKRPMVVGYRLDAFAYRLVKMFKLIKVPQVAMANILAGRGTGPGIHPGPLPGGVDGAGPAGACWRMTSRLAEIQETYAGIHRQLRRDAGRQAAQALLELVAAA